MPYQDSKPYGITVIGHYLNKAHIVTPDRDNNPHPICNTTPTGDRLFGDIWFENRHAVNTFFLKHVNPDIRCKRCQNIIERYR